MIPPGAGNLAPAYLQAAITAALAVLCWILYRWYRKVYFAWWAVAWTVFACRIGAIIIFLSTTNRAWLYWHQVFTGWTALALLWAALVFSRQLTWRWRYLPVVLFPPLWSFVAVYVLQNFLLAAGPAVLFLSAATLVTGWVFLRHYHRVGGAGAGVLAWSLLIWGINHLNYPFLRARGALNPWSYYLDIGFELLIGSGILLAVHDDLRRGLLALAGLSRNLQSGPGGQDMLEGLLQHPLNLPAVRGCALYLRTASEVGDATGPGGGGGGGGGFVGAAGACAAWVERSPTGSLATAMTRALASGRPEVVTAYTAPDAEYPFTAVIPVLRKTEAIGALVLVGEARDPFTALDEGFLAAVGHLVGGALENADLYRRLQDRNRELAQLSNRMVQHHEEERRRLSRELHDETAQVFSAVRMELSLLRDAADPAGAQRLGHLLELTDSGIQSIRNVTHHLRPPLLDDLGLVPALRSLALEMADRSGLTITVDAPAAGSLPPLSKDGELALFRALQEALSNVLRHAEATTVAVSLSRSPNGVRLLVRDDGRGFRPGPGPAGGNGRMGLTGMRERLTALGGSVTLRAAPGGGAEVDVTLPVAMEKR